MRTEPTDEQWRLAYRHWRGPGTLEQLKADPGAKGICFRALALDMGRAPPLSVQPALRSLPRVVPPVPPTPAHAPAKRSTELLAPPGPARGRPMHISRQPQAAPRQSGLFHRKRAAGNDFDDVDDE